MDLKDLGPLATAVLVALAAGVAVLSQVDVSGSGAPEQTGGEAAAPPVFVDYMDAVQGFSLRVPESWQRFATSEPDDLPPRVRGFAPTEAAGEPDYALAFGPDPKSPLMDISIWESDPERASLMLWLGVTAGPYEPIGDALPNAVIAGNPAAVVRIAADDGVRALAAFAEHDGSYVRLRFAPGTPEELVNATLASLAWNADDLPNQIPRVEIDAEN